jgi:hypothetical protein
VLGETGVASILRTVVWEICCPEGTHRTLSRRDWMIVARQFIAWNTPKKGEPSRRDGVSWATPHIRRPWSKNVLSTESYRSLRDGFFVWHTPGNKLPGYDHSVPPGQKTLNACPRIRRRISVLGLRCRNNPELKSKGLQACWVKRLFEDEDDDEDDLRREKTVLLRFVVMNVPRITADTSSR